MLGELLGFASLVTLAFLVSLVCLTFPLRVWEWETGLSEPTEDVGVGVGAGLSGVLGLAGGGDGGRSTSLLVDLPLRVV